MRLFLTIAAAAAVAAGVLIFAASGDDGATPPACAADQYRAYPEGDACGKAGAPGVCRPRPEACAAVYAPVCGCDAETYSNACVANSEGASVARDGACETPRVDP